MVIVLNQIILASHGNLSKGMLDMVEMILGNLTNVYAVSTLRDESENIIQATNLLIESFSENDDVYILTDVLGGSVNNDMLTLLEAHPDVTIICGMNACLVLSLASIDEKISTQELASMIQDSRDQLFDCTAKIKEQSIEEVEDL